MEDESVSCTPSTTLFRSPQTCDSSFTQLVFTPLEITRDSSNDASTSRRRDSSDSEEDHKRVRMTLGSSSPDPTPNPDDPPSTSAPINSPVRALGWRDQHIPTAPDSYQGPSHAYESIHRSARFRYRPLDVQRGCGSSAEWGGQFRIAHHGIFD
jgi:hypothetical protein